MTDNQSELFALPARYTDLEQSQEILEELAVQLDLFSPRCFTLARPCTCLTLCFAPYRGGFLLGDGIANTVYERDEKCKVNGA